MTSEITSMPEVKELKEIDVSHVQIEGEMFYKISNYDAMRPFFMSIVSDSNHWMFISSNGGLSAGRKDAENALFPYYTEDKITESAEITGSKSLFQVAKDGRSHLWEPFSYRNYGLYEITRNLYKSTTGNKVIFEEINKELGLIFRYQWNSSDRFGFVKRSKLINYSNEEIKISIVDGIQNIMPYGVPSAVQNQSSVLVDAYKRHELETGSGLGIYALSAIIVDKAEPSEALKSNVAWSLGLDDKKVLLSSLQLNNFRKNIPLHQEVDVKAEKGAYFVHADIVLPPKGQQEWMIVADVNKNHSAIVKIVQLIRAEGNLEMLVKKDVEDGTSRLVELVASADGLQLTADNYRDSRHFSNTLFNIMRGGIFDDDYRIEKSDFTDYIAKANNVVFGSMAPILEDLPELLSLFQMQELASSQNNADFKRLCLEYMPLKFSRRHGDPSRPWNRFSINTTKESDGSKILDYEGNWRDIFQNWEALAYSYPGYIESMIHKFLNASTLDGYNPYRITKGGVDWETIEPDDPWSYIGYWGDHQIIYLLKLLETINKHYPDKLTSLFDQEIFVYANVPYRIKSYQDILMNPKDTIAFDEQDDKRIREKMVKIGADGALLKDNNGSIHHVNFIEKILATVLSKISNLIPEAGIWMNTQRPEWNDANNALVGNGVSMVTLYYLRRFLKFFELLLADYAIEKVQISMEMVELFNSINEALLENEHLLDGKINNVHRKSILDKFGQAASDYRLNSYQHSFEGIKLSVSIQELKTFFNLSLRYLEHSIDANKRQDQLYHAYNLMTIEGEDKISISHLSEMLEGQVGVLSSGYLSSNEALELLDNLKKSALFREDQYSYLLYPKKQLPGFLEKNNIPKHHVNASRLLGELLKNGNTQIIEKDDNDICHFNGNFKNAIDLNEALDELSKTSYAPLVESERELILQTFEEVFNHKAFTGRSGTFYGYEGLGSIYWHMVSKLQLAVQECCLKAIDENESEEVVGRLLAHYYEINEGIGVHKSPELYGAFPTDPYSHTPAGKGAQQPGMTGQVKEDIICRFGELGVFIKEGKLYFDPCLLRKNEFLNESKLFQYIDVFSEQKEIHLEEASLCFTYCQVPIVYSIGDVNGIEVQFDNGNSTKFHSLSLDLSTSKQVFDRTGKINKITVDIKESYLR